MRVGIERRDQRGTETSGFARGHSVARVLGIGIPLGMFLLWWGIWGGHAKVRSVSETTAAVLSCEGHTCKVRVATGEQVRILQARDLVAGMQVRMTRTEYSDGELRFALRVDSGRGTGAE
jgi:hypothetical protein